MARNGWHCTNERCRALLGTVAGKRHLNLTSDAVPNRRLLGGWVVLCAKCGTPRRWVGRIHG